MERIKDFVSHKLASAGQPRVYRQDDLVVQEEKASYSPWAVKTGRVGLMVWNKYLWGPCAYVWRFLARWTNLTFWIFVGIFVGIMIGYFQPGFAQEIEPLGTAFIRMIKIIVVPLIFSTLVLGIAGHSEEISTVGKLAIKTIIVSYFFGPKVFP